MAKGNNEIGTDLCMLAKLLHENGLCPNVSPLQNAGQACLSKSTDLKWKYRLDKIVFEADKVGTTIPEQAEDISVSLSIEEIEGGYFTTGEVINPLNKLKFDIEIDGFRLNTVTSEIDQLFASWHLDRHISSVGNGETKYTHPIYHFQFGGNIMEGKGDLFGNSLILPAPRIMYPPMDAILGIDFILKNYLNRTRIIKLINDPQYLQIVRNSQIRLWKPFFISLFSFWEQIDHKISVDFSPLKLMPFYC